MIEILDVSCPGGVVDGQERGLQCVSKRWLQGVRAPSTIYMARTSPSPTELMTRPPSKQHP